MQCSRANVAQRSLCEQLDFKFGNFLDALASLGLGDSLRELMIVSVFEIFLAVTDLTHFCDIMS